MIIIIHDNNNPITLFDSNQKDDSYYLMENDGN